LKNKVAWTNLMCFGFRWVLQTESHISIKPELLMLT
jgi:hypothetical protein